MQLVNQIFFLHDTPFRTPEFREKTAKNPLCTFYAPRVQTQSTCVSRQAERLGLVPNVLFFSSAFSAGLINTCIVLTKSHDLFGKCALSFRNSHPRALNDAALRNFLPSRSTSTSSPTVRQRVCLSRYSKSRTLPLRNFSLSPRAREENLKQAGIPDGTRLAGWCKHYSKPLLPAPWEKDGQARGNVTWRNA